ncbi:hypothetical protein EVAR_49778_1 [Eumeta japonica]|uniref:Uncharacterized protein n=1 Tax=Eumeta variegata TaxID=151549 RepID=A0A4C1Y0A1_EUMVA|nr:hypothetical protein EVAR_49778_1 [Eumeta japonica]
MERTFVKPRRRRYHYLERGRAGAAPAHPRRGNIIPLFTFDSRNRGPNVCAKPNLCDSCKTRKGERREEYIVVFATRGGPRAGDLRLVKRETLRNRSCVTIFGFMRKIEACAESRLESTHFLSHLDCLDSSRIEYSQYIAASKLGKMWTSRVTRPCQTAAIRHFAKLTVALRVRLGGGSGGGSVESRNLRLCVLRPCATQTPAAARRH